MYTVGMRVQMVDSGELGTIVGIASAKQLLTIQTLSGQVLRVTGDAVRKLDEIEWNALLGETASGPELQVGMQ